MIDCEKCSQSPSAVLVIDVPDYIHDKLAGWFMCQACFDRDPDGWYEVVDAKQFDDGPKRRKKPRLVVPERSDSTRASDELIAHAYQLHQGGMRMCEVAREVMKLHPYKNEQSACASLRVNFKKRGLEILPRRSAVAA